MIPDKNMFEGRVSKVRPENQRLASRAEERIFLSAPRRTADSSPTVLPAKSDSDVICCLQSVHGLIIDRSLVYLSYPR